MGVRLIQDGVQRMGDIGTGVGVHGGAVRFVDEDTEIASVRPFLARPTGAAHASTVGGGTRLTSLGVFPPDCFCHKTLQQETRTQAHAAKVISYY